MSSDFPWVTLLCVAHFGKINLFPGAGLVELEHLALSRNSLTGSIPKEFGNLKRLGWLFLSQNQLSGNIPKEISGLKSLRCWDRFRTCFLYLFIPLIWITKRACIFWFLVPQRCHPSLFVCKDIWFCSKTSWLETSQPNLGNYTIWKSWSFSTINWVATFHQNLGAWRQVVQHWPCAWVVKI